MLTVAVPTTQAQQVLVQANVADDTIKTAFGPNRRYFLHPYLSYGLVAGASGGPGTALRYGFSSADIQLGTRLKRRFSQALAATLDARYAHTQYTLRQNDQKTLPATTRHQAENLSLHQLQAELGLRLNASHRRGNTVGNYLDLLAWGTWVASSSHTTEEEPAAGVSSVETTERGLPYLRRCGGGLGVRLGADRYALSARYRLSSAFAVGFGPFDELPRWVLGLEIGLF